MIWTPEETQQLKDLYLNGEKARIIAEITGRSQKAVESKIKKLDINRRDYIPPHRIRSAEDMEKLRGFIRCVMNMHIFKNA